MLKKKVVAKKGSKMQYVVNNSSMSKYYNEETQQKPAAPEGVCIGIDQYWSPTGDCVEVWRAWDAYCWTYEYSTDDCYSVERQVFLDPSLLDPDIPQEECYVSTKN